ncbi:lon protease 1 [Perilla frutescens var. frutescens]|nr:lon protease 1 [Perilla frutescens var. frutescens]
MQTRSQKMQAIQWKKYKEENLCKGYFSLERKNDENFDVIRAQEILDEDNYGLTDVKESILEFIAVGKLRETAQDYPNLGIEGKMVSLSGPLGVGKLVLAVPLLGP